MADQATTTSTTTAGAAAPGTTAPAATTTTSAPATQSEWTAGLNDELKGYVQNKGFKAPQDVLESYRNFEKLQGVPQERILKLPEDMNTPEGRAIFERLGTPKDAKDYNIQVPKDGGDPKFAEWAQGTFLTRAQSDVLVQAHNESVQAQMKTMTDQRQAVIQQAEQNLRKEWGNAFDQNKNMADQGAIALGMGEKEVAALGSALGPDKAMKLLLSLATATGEHPFVSGQSSSNGVLAPDQAKSKITEMLTDTNFRDRLNKGDVEAKRQWDNAHKMAYPGTIGL